jgi:hypothetical protein
VVRVRNGRKQLELIRIPNKVLVRYHMQSQAPKGEISGNSYKNSADSFPNNQIFS